MHRCYPQPLSGWIYDFFMSISLAPIGGFIRPHRILKSEA
jgi:hypothetical protein